MNQQTGEVIPREKFRKFAVSHRDQEKKGKEDYEKISNRSALFADPAIILLELALFFFAGIKIFALTI